MDKKSTAIGISLLAAALGLFLYSNHEQSKYDEAQRAKAAEYAKLHPAPTPAKPVAGEATTGSSTTGAAPAVVETPAAPEQIIHLSNGVIDAAVTTHGAALKTVALIGHAAVIGGDAKTAPVLFNEKGPSPALALSFPNAEGKPVAWLPSFSVKEKSDTHVILEAKRADGLIVTREFSVVANKEASEKSKRDLHLVAHTTTFRREGGVAAPVVTGMNLGTLTPSEGDPHNQFLNVSAYDGDNYEKIGVDKFADASGFLGFGAHKAVPDVNFSKGATPIRWVAASNQFFAGIATFGEKSRDFATGLYAHPVTLGKNADGAPIHTVTAEAGLNLGALAPGESKSVSLDYFVGPKEYTRLAALGDQQDKVVQFVKFMGLVSINWLCKLLMASLSGLHWLIPANPWAWGLAIVALTTIIKGATWPLTGLQMKAAENMKKLAEPMKELKEKYKDNPQKLQQETMKLYSQHKVNPFAGCLPIFIQMPIFTGLYTAFQTCAELRHQPFLWFPDLSVADTIPGLPPYIHILPILMGVTMLVNMRLTPMTNVDPNQKMMFYGMMALFPVMCYASPAGLTLYWTVNNLLTLLQTWQRKLKTAKAEAANKTGAVEIIPPTKAKNGNGKAGKSKKA
jgi:YidC/Oxa1 family membrane protein insertase